MFVVWNIIKSKHIATVPLKASILGFIVPEVTRSLTSKHIILRAVNSTLFSVGLNGPNKTKVCDFRHYFRPKQEPITMT